jgi:hypothetical protein
MTGLVKSALKKNDGMNKIDSSQPTTNQIKDPIGETVEEDLGKDSINGQNPLPWRGEGFSLQGWVRADRKEPTPTPLPRGE